MNFNAHHIKELLNELKDAAYWMKNKRLSQCGNNEYVLAKDAAYSAASKYRKACNKERFDFLVNRESKKVPLTDQENEWCNVMWNHGTMYTSKDLIRMSEGSTGTKENGQND
tara:strand:- start:454 stop:789 length:336 start_codon:yes stop_codon:yes gene_type:complete